MFIKRLFTVLAVNIIIIAFVFKTIFNIDSNVFIVVLTLIANAYLIVFNVIPIKNIYPTRNLYILSGGIELLKNFLIVLFTSIVIHMLVIIYLVVIQNSSDLSIVISSVVFVIIAQLAIFWNGIIRVYLTSLQLGIQHRVLGIIFGWFLGLNIYYLNKIISICSREVNIETDKIEVNNNRISEQICKTKYPILMVHGVFFRDFRYLNYWGRVPDELKKNGATIFYGEQQSAASVESCGKEIAQKIEEIVSTTGCEKVNIIAHSKGGLDSRAAISYFGSDKYVASLTTINTPHQGCIFTEYLLNKMSDKVKKNIATTYNATLQKLGEKTPDFIGAVVDLSITNCKTRNETMIDSPKVLYESFTSYCIKPSSGKFPLNLSYNFVKKFDGVNDGLVAIESAKWGSNFTLLEPTGKRGISHGDLIDLNRENIEGFDVREFYVKLVESLKDRGY